MLCYCAGGGFLFILFFIIIKLLPEEWFEKYEKEEKERWKKCNEEMSRIIQEIIADNERTIAELRKKKLGQERNKLLSQMGKLKSNFPKEAE